MSYKLPDNDLRIPLDDERVKIGKDFLELGKIDNFILVGAGGTSLVYLARINKERACIVKEYWPKEKSIYNVEYTRDYESGRIILKGKNEQIDKEKEAQKSSEHYEVEVNKELYYDQKKPDSNSNHMFHVQGNDSFFYIGDTCYTIFETTNGKTLYDKVRETSNGKLEILSALNIIRVLVEIVDFIYSARGYVHTDLKPENIWVGNDNEENDVGENIYIIDFGSAFSWKKLREKEYSTHEDYFNLVKEVVSNPGIGWSSDNYCSIIIADLLDIKDDCKELLEDDNLRELFAKSKDLLNQINKIDISVDLYSVVKIFYFMILGKDYDYSAPIKADKLSELIGCKVSVAEYINHIMNKNSNSKYHNIDTLKYDLQCLEALYKGEASPFVWLKEVVNGPKLELGRFDKELVPDVRE